MICTPADLCVSSFLLMSFEISKELCRDGGAAIVYARCMCTIEAADRERNTILGFAKIIMKRSPVIDLATVAQACLSSRRSVEARHRVHPSVIDRAIVDRALIRWSQA